MVSKPNQAFEPAQAKCSTSKQRKTRNNANNILFDKWPNALFGFNVPLTEGLVAFVIRALDKHSFHIQRSELTSSMDYKHTKTQQLTNAPTQQLKISSTHKLTNCKNINPQIKKLKNLQAQKNINPKTQKLKLLFFYFTTTLYFSCHSSENLG